jgi:MraZ protein
MTNFIGDFSCKLDAKGRIMLPVAFKKQLLASEPSARETFVVKKDIFENCLVLFPISEWERQVEIIRTKLNPYNKEHNIFLRGFHRGKAEVEMDNNNRLLIPKRLLDLVNIDKEVILAGLDGKIEIWAKEVYDTMEQNDNDFALLAEKILGS